MYATPSAGIVEVGGDESNENAVGPRLEVAWRFRTILCRIGRDVDPLAKRRHELGIAGLQMLHDLAASMVVSTP